MAKRRFIAYLEVDEETLLGTSDHENIIEALEDEFLWSKASGIDIKRLVEDERLSNTVDLPLYITVVDGKVAEIWYDSNYSNQDCILNEKDFSITYESSQ
jgi:hypothetical protein